MLMFRRENPSPDASFTLLPEAIVVPLKAKPANGTATTNGNAAPDPTVPASPVNKRKRSANEAELEIEQITKRGKVAEEPNGNGVNDASKAMEAIVVVDDGTIVLD